jgi:hypothetical protein
VPRLDVVRRSVAEGAHDLISKEVKDWPFRMHIFAANK